MCKLTADEKKDIENGIPMTVISIDSKGDIKESESIVKKYGGYLTRASEDGAFSTEVLLPQ